MWRDARDAILDLEQACNEARSFAASSDDLASPQALLQRRAIERCLAIMGEAAKRVSAPLREKYPEVPWREMAGLRDVLVHDYFGVDVVILQDVVDSELPRVSEALARLVDAEGWERE